MLCKGSALVFARDLHRGAGNGGHVYPALERTFFSTDEIGIWKALYWRCGACGIRRILDGPACSTSLCPRDARPTPSATAAPRRALSARNRLARI